MRKFSLRSGPGYCVSRKAARVEANLAAEPSLFSRGSRRILAILAIFAMSSVALGPAASAEPIADKVVVLDPGIYQAVTAGPHRTFSTLGPVAGVRNETLVASTTTIPARKSLRFGLRYVVQGAAHGDHIDIQLITRFPDPGLTNPAIGTNITESQYSVRTVIGTVRYREFRFDHFWEIIPGEWVFEFWHGGRKIGSQKFCVVQPSQEDQPGAHSSHVSCDHLVS